MSIVTILSEHGGGKHSVTPQLHLGSGVTTTVGTTENAGPVRTRQRDGKVTKSVVDSANNKHIMLCVNHLVGMYDVKMPLLEHPERNRPGPLNHEFQNPRKMPAIISSLGRNDIRSNGVRKRTHGGWVDGLRPDCTPLMGGLQYYLVHPRACLWLEMVLWRKCICQGRHHDAALSNVGSHQWMTGYATAHGYN